MFLKNILSSLFRLKGKDLFMDDQAAKVSLRRMAAEAEIRDAEKRRAAWSGVLAQLRKIQSDAVVSVVDVTDKQCEARVILANRREVTLKPLRTGEIEVCQQGKDWYQCDPCAGLTKVAELLSKLSTRN